MLQRLDDRQRDRPRALDDPDRRPEPLAQFRVLTARCSPVASRLVLPLPGKGADHLGREEVRGSHWGREVILGAVKLVFGAELRRRWRSWAILVLLIAVVAGLVLAAAAAGRRTAAAFPSFVASRGYDVYIYNQEPVPGLSRLPGVSSVTAIATPASGQPSCACTTHAINPSNFYINELSPHALSRVVKLVGGRMPCCVVTVRRAGLLHARTGLRGAHRFGHSCAALCIVTVAGTGERRQRVSVRTGGCAACRGNRSGRNGVSVRVDTRIRPLHHAGICEHHQPESSARVRLPRSAAST